MNYIQLDLEISPIEPWRDLINAELGDIGYESFVDTDNGTQAFVQIEEYSEGKLNDLLEGYSDSCKTSYTTEEIQSVNWNEEWEKNFDPIDVDGTCIIHATFHKIEKQYPFDIVINPKMSFGTGHHATTYLVMQQMLNMNFQDTDVLDMGCGTSVLAILASKMGARNIFAIDYDEWCVENSAENCELNNVTNIEIAQGSKELLLGRNFNTILANINLNVLIDQIPTYVNVLEPDGTILFSGVLEQDQDKLEFAIKENGLIIEEIKHRNKWIVARCRKIS